MAIQPQKRKLFMRHTILPSTNQQLQSKENGFTLVEILAVAPIILLVIGAVTGVVISLTRASMVSQGKTQILYDVQLALDTIERDVEKSVNINPASTLQLQLTNVATNKSPLDPTRQTIRETDCSVSSGQLPLGQTLKYDSTYVASGTGLNRNTSLTKTTCSPAWQKNNTSEQLITGANVTLGVVYSLNSEDPPKAYAAKVTITATRKVAGQDVSATGSVYIKSLNIQP